MNRVKKVFLLLSHNMTSILLSNFNNVFNKIEIIQYKNEKEVEGCFDKFKNSKIILLFFVLADFVNFKANEKIIIREKVNRMLVGIGILDFTTGKKKVEFCSRSVALGRIKWIVIILKLKISVFDSIHLRSEAVKCYSYGGT